MKKINNYYSCYDKQIDLEKCISVVIKTKKKEEIKKEKLSDYEIKFIKKNFDFLKSYTNFKTYFYVQLKDKAKEELEEKINSFKFEAKKYIDCDKKTNSNFTNNDLDVVKNTIMKLDKKTALEGLEKYLKKFNLNLNDIENGFLAIVHTYMDKPNCSNQEYFEWHPIIGEYDDYIINVIERE